jgi:transposase
MNEVSIIGLDLAKTVFQAHGAAADGAVVFRRKLTRPQVLRFFAAQPNCVVAMEACASAHHWARAIGSLGHEVRLIAPLYVKPFVKRQKNDASDAEAIAEAASRPTMRFVAPKTEAQQAAAMAFRTRDLFVRQRTQTINALRGHLAEHGIVVPSGPAHVGRLGALVQGEDGALPRPVVELARMLLQHIGTLTEQIAMLEKDLRDRMRHDATAARLMTIPGIGPICASAMTTFAPPAETFAKGRDFAAWIGLTPLQHSTGGRERLGRTSKMGQRDLRRLLIIGAVAVVRWAARRGAPRGSWLERMMARKPRMLVAVALANRMARIAWALMAHGGVYRDPATAVA